MYKIMYNIWSIFSGVFLYLAILIVTSMQASDRDVETQPTILRRNDILKAFMERLKNATNITTSTTTTEATEETTTDLSEKGVVVNIADVENFGNMTSPKPVNTTFPSFDDLFDEEENKTSNITDVETTTTPKPTKSPKTTTLVPIADRDHKKFLYDFALYNCERMRDCNVIPTDFKCGRDSYYGTFAWFDNICVLWKANCFRLGLWFVKDKKHCGSQSLLTYTDSMIDPKNWRTKLKFNPFLQPS